MSKVLCQYCGKDAPSVQNTLMVTAKDHTHPQDKKICKRLPREAFCNNLSSTLLKRNSGRLKDIC